MELRKDPLTRSWVLTGDDIPETAPRPATECRICPGSKDRQQISSRAAIPGQGGPWSARTVVHPNAIYHIEGEVERRGQGLYDRMPPVGAHEVLVENPKHDRQLWQADDAEIEQFLLLAAQRIQDLKGDARFRYISVFKNHGPGSGQEFDHPNSQLTATTFIPRRVLYELRAGLDYYKQKERCVFCDMHLGGLVKRTLQRIRTITESFHLVLHTSPNRSHVSASLGYWKTLDDDYHWHIEILPILAAKAKSYTFKEVYYSPVSPETAAKRLREAAVDI